MSPAFGLVVLVAVGCGGRPPRPPELRSQPVRLVHGGGGPEVDRVLDVLYGGDFVPEKARELARLTLERYPDAAAAHEAAGYLATLADDPHLTWLHFWKAAQDLDSPLTSLYLWELDVDPTRAELEANVALYEALRTSHPRAATRSVATMAEAFALRQLGRLAEATALSRSLGFIQDWAILGAFDNEDGKGFLTTLPPERDINFANPADGPFVPLAWRRVPMPTELGAVIFGRFVSPQEAAVAYLVTWVHADADVDARLCLSTGDAARAWVNQGLVLSEARIDQGALDNLTAPVRLRQGWNQLLVKSAQRRGHWWLRARFTDARGLPLAGLSYAAEPRPFRPAPDSRPDVMQALPPELDQVAPPNRRTFLAARWSMRGGNLRRRQVELEALLGRAPGNLLAVYNLALAYWAAEEAGKAIDLGNRGVERGGAAVPAFLHFRARYHAQRHLLDGALTDYAREIELTGAARVAERDLAELFRERGWRVDRCRQLEATARKWPDDVSTARDLGRCQLALGYTGLGVATLKRAFDMAPGADATVEQLFDRAVEESQFAEAHRWLGILEELAPTAPGHLVQGADLSRREGHAVDAEAQLRAAASLNPGWARPHERLGDLFWEQGRKADALTEWRLAQRREPTNSVLAQRIEFHEPTRLGFIERYVPSAEVIEEALRRKVAPRAGARVAMLIDDEVTEVESDGSAKHVVTLVRQALDEHGRDELIAERVPRVGELKLLRAYSVSKTGERQEASSIRDGEVRFRSLEIGSRVVLQYVHYAPPGKFLKNHFVSSFYFRSPTAQEDAPRWTLVLPKDRPLRVHVEGPVTLEETVVADRRVRIWSARDALPLIAEVASPPLDELLWRVNVSTVPDWDEYVRWERALLADAFRSTPGLEALAARLTAGASEPRDKLDRLYEYVTKEIRYQQDYENTVAGVQPHASSVVIERGYGDCKDKAVLLMQLAKLAGIKLKFAILRTTSAGRLVAEVPNQQFNHAIVYVPVQPGIDEPFFLDATADALDLGNLRPDDQGATSLVLDPETGAWEMIPIPFQPPELSYTRVALHVDLKSPGEAQVTAALTTRGAAAMALRRVRRNKTIADKALQAMAAQVLPGSTLTGSDWPAEEDTRKPVALEMHIDGSRAIHAEEDHFRFSLPSTIDLSRWSTLEVRETPLVLGVLSDLSETLSFVLPEGYLPVHVPADFAVAQPCFTVERHAATTGRTIKVAVSLHRVCDRIQVADYQAFRDTNRDLVSKLRDEISFKKAAPPAATRRKPRL